MTNSINFAAEFQKSKNHIYEEFFNSYTESPELIKAQKELRKIQKAAENKLHEITILQNERYNADFVPAPEKYYATYSGRNDNYHFDISTGELIEEPKDSIEIVLTTKSGTLSYVKGYDFKVASVLIREVKYTINSSNTEIKFSKSKEILVPMMEEIDTKILSDVTSVVSNIYEIPEKALNKTNANFFINHYFGIDVNISISLKRLKNYLNCNKSTEIILKTANDNTIIYNLLDRVVDKPLPIHKIVGCSKKDWELACKEGVQYTFLKFKQMYSNDSLKSFKKTDADWIEFFKYTQSKEQDLEFYGITYDRNLAFNLLKRFIGEDYYDYKNFRKYYKFGKFCNYVIDETINQGISSIDNFIQLLSDYIRMCEDIGINPTLYSSYLKQTHDICSRNHKISVTKEMDNLFISKYKDFVTYTGDKYCVIAPKACSDLQKEGDALNHCVASYITRVINDECKIFFLRDNRDIKSSLITIEVRDNAIVQARGIHNRDINLYESLALQEFAAQYGLKYKI